MTSKFKNLQWVVIITENIALTWNHCYETQYYRTNGFKLQIRLVEQKNVPKQYLIYIDKI